jgi:hypothetical protein
MQINPSFPTTPLSNLISNVNPGTNHVPKTRLDMEHFSLALLPNVKPHGLLRRLAGEHDAVCSNCDMA